MNSGKSLYQNKLGKVGRCSGVPTQGPVNCMIGKACLYVTYLAERLSYSSIVAYYNAVVYMHVCKGLEPVRVSNPVLRATLEGIGKHNGKGQKGKEPFEKSGSSS